MQGLAMLAILQDPQPTLLRWSEEVGPHSDSSSWEALGGGEKLPAAGAEGEACFFGGGMVEG